jgi:hypothetical protein
MPTLWGFTLVCYKVIGLTLWTVALVWYEYEGSPMGMFFQSVKIVKAHPVVVTVAWYEYESSTS